jgi:transcriptional regulator with XRE-family HTH domain
VRISFGRLIRRYREIQGWSQQELADRVDGLAEIDLARIERGDAVLPGRAVLDNLAEALELSPRLVLAASGWFAMHTDHFDFSDPAELPPAQLLMIYDELAGWQDLQRELLGWMDNVRESLDEAQADDARDV